MLSAHLQSGPVDADGVENDNGAEEVFEGTHENLTPATR